ncbi:hypothetical protein GTA08_BOTSDO03075 [Neofusicoccum parvum]|uniref:Uncharacterized protein n=1 Tax=Neofusicoccum parvum TaxID=310453 RepID=A0ACB5SK11_9PEZI|nr:hypothetical protein GTA08_BOTSDO03075 [Neofusicoccum parvum]
MRNQHQKQIKPANRSPAMKRRVCGKRRLGFLDLPGEIRNEIYAYCFEDEIWIDMTPNANHMLAQKAIRPGTWSSHALQTSFAPANTNAAAAATVPSPLRLPAITKPKPHKIRYHPSGRSSPPPPTDWTRSAGALVRTSRQIHAEALPFFYATAFFIFSAPRALRRFLALLPPRKLALVRKLHVAHATYGDPATPADGVWKVRSDEAWAVAMREAAARLTGLEVLRVRVVVNERPLVFGLGAEFVRALMVWGEASRPGGGWGGEGYDVVRQRGVAEREPLRVEVAVQSAWVAKGAAMPDRRLAEAHVELHRLFSEAVRRRLLGWSEADAMVEYNLVKFDKYKNLVERYPIP